MTSSAKTYIQEHNGFEVGENYTVALKVISRSYHSDNEREVIHFVDRKNNFFSLHVDAGEESDLQPNTKPTLETFDVDNIVESEYTDPKTGEMKMRIFKNITLGSTDWDNAEARS